MSGPCLFTKFRDQLRDAQKSVPNYKFSTLAKVSNKIKLNQIYLKELIAKLSRYIE